MTTFTVWKFEDADGAARAESSLKAAAGEGLVTIVDHAIVSWPERADKPTLEHKHDSPKRGAAWGALWGILGGALFAIPVAGLALGAGIGALAKATDGTGITKADLERIRTEVVPGTSALFLVTDSADLDRLGERFHGRDSTLISTNLTEAERATLLETFGGA
ncbi:DUF1269 domain-containing protein [Nocardioides sp. MAH-18]|uniref:DUF1269 domain-containing protein n=1 Tax=Nocardioides agri TaxID=2682843 RepID=A0A6L6XLQ2_9ACTN|nr:MULTISPECIES: DUF1269 domain-containing protein [unclassified Nocardioides]MBA2956536.1 DUF1269 domain-containing protein [Nocardioides sp. CGMCC 1.13656]MVQ47683.1 DUF1269 domain-containing protein [Nocardioides sp. MAH-18]